MDSPDKKAAAREKKNETFTSPIEQYNATHANSKLYDLSIKEIEAFIHGYDQAILPPTYNQPSELEMYQLGKECFIAMQQHDEEQTMGK